MDIEGKKIIRQRRTYWEELNPSEKIGKLKQWGVHTLLCGGINAFNKNQLQSHGIEVVSELRGRVEEVFERWVRQSGPGNTSPETSPDPMPSPPR